MPVVGHDEWQEFMNQHPNAHLLQTAAWGDLKSDFGWDVERVLAGGSSGLQGAQVLFRRLPLGFSAAYLPRGPVGGQPDGGIGRWDQLWPEIDRLCRSRRAVFLKVEPDLWEQKLPAGSGAGQEDRLPSGFRVSSHSVQPQRTLMIDITGDEERVLARMKQKTRYNIRLALRKGIVVRPIPDIEKFYQLMEVTGGRDEFGIHSLDYYRRAFELFHPQQCQLLFAEYQHEPLAAVMVFARGRRAWYFYGASSNKHREKMPTYILQWEAMRWARELGCTEYDLYGVPDADEKTLEAQFLDRQDGLWGVYRFKRGFGGDLRRSFGPWDRIYQPLLYTVYGLWAGRLRS